MVIDLRSIECKLAGSEGNSIMFVSPLARIEINLKLKTFLKERRSKSLFYDFLKTHFFMTTDHQTKSLDIIETSTREKKIIHWKILRDGDEKANI